MKRKRANGEGTIYHRKDGRWVAVISLGAGMRKISFSPLLLARREAV